MNQTPYVRPQVLGNIGEAAHLFEVGTTVGKIEVHANTRAIARRIAERAGFVVRDVNMVG